jgi:hypothetical protein
MLSASAMRYGGPLIDAADCNYNSFKDLGLICPFCKQSVFLVGSTSREAHDRKRKDGTTVSVKAVETIAAHFKHHKDVDSTSVAECELRSSKLTPFQYKKTAAAARNQRSRIFQRRMWQMLQSSVTYRVGDDVSLAAVFTYSFGPKAAGALRLIVDSISDAFRDENIPEAKQRLNHHFEALISESSVFRSDMPDDLAADMQTWSQSVHQQLQIEICAEVVDFLATKMQSRILGSLVERGIISFLRCHYIKQATGIEEITQAYAAYQQRWSMETPDLDAALLVNSPPILTRLFNTSGPFNHEFTSHVFNYLLDSILLVRWSDQFNLLAQASPRP